MNKIDVLNGGYVRLVDHFGSDLKIVNAARVSFEKESKEWTDKDEKLLNFLWREKHHSVFRHAALTFEFYAPLMVARQHHKYVVASTHTEDQLGWNESSRRYITEEPEFYIPNTNEWRSAPINKKQGSGEVLSENEGGWLTGDLKTYINKGLELYEEALASGVCAEQARLFLPAYGLYIRYYWTCSLASFMHFLTERIDKHAQHEIRLYAQAAKDLAVEIFPKTISLIND